MVTGKPRRTAQSRSRPLDAARLEELALAYVARFATSRAKLADYLRRKLRERGWDGEGDPPIERLVERLAEAGYVDDRAYAVAKSGGLLRRGYGSRRVAQALSAAGIDVDIREEVAAGPSDLRAAALAMARKRGFGPFGRVEPDKAQREKQLAAMLRAGHSLDIARAVISAASEETAEQWAMED